MVPESILEQSSFLVFGSVTSFFGIKVYVFCAFLENDKTYLSQIFFQGLGENVMVMTLLK